MPRILILAALALSMGSALAKLPAPSDEAKAKAAEAAAKTAHGNKVADFQLCKSMDRVAAAYRADAKKAGKDLPKPTDTPACADPGAFVYTPPDAKPLEAAGAHSPARTAAQPPSTTTPAAAMPPRK